MLVALLASVVTSAGYAQDADSDVEAKILATEHMWGQAYVSKDPKALERILDDAFANVDSDGILQTKAEVLAEVRASTVQQFLTESMVVHLHGNTAIVTGVFQIEGINHGKPWPFEHLEGERVKAQSHNGNHALDLVFDNALVNTAK